MPSQKLDHVSMSTPRLLLIQKKRFITSLFKKKILYKQKINIISKEIKSETLMQYILSLNLFSKTCIKGKKNN